MANMSKKSSANAVSKNSSVAPSSTTTAASSDKSSILKSSFAPSTLQLHLFASVIQSFDAQQLRIHDTATGHLRQQHAAQPGATITSLDWGYYGASVQDSQLSSQKKRKRSQAVPEEIVIAYGTSTSEVCMYSPAHGRVVGQLNGAHEKGIKDFKFSKGNLSEGWSIGGDGKLIQWDLSTGQPLRTVSLPDPSINVLATPSSVEPSILCASTTPFSIDFSSSDDFRIESYDSFKHIIHSVVWSGQSLSQSEKLFLAVDSDRYMNIFNMEQKKLVRTLVAGSEVEHIDLNSVAASKENIPQEEVLAAITRDGVVELFSQPFVQQAATNGDIKSKRKGMTKKANAQVKLLHQDTKKSAPIFDASFQGPDLVLVSVDSGIEPSFQKIRWQDEGTGGLLFEGIKEVSRVRSASTLTSATMNGVKDMGKTHVDESRTTVMNGLGDLTSQDAAIEISSDDEDENDEGESEDEQAVEDAAVGDEEASEVSDEDMEDAGAMAIITQGGKVGEDVEMEEAQDEEPTFGERLASKHPNTITIADAFASEKSTLDLGNKQLAIPSGMSLGTVLTQALRTNDQNLLETCLHANDHGIIQNTIQRLDSSLASILLSKLAERLASRPGRYGHLLSWVQWTCIAHGAAIAGQPEVTAKIRTLYRVLSQRSKSFEKLLLLKGKLDMLDAQLTFRKQLQAQRGEREGQDEPGMIYIEGEEDNWSSEDDHDEVAGAVPKLGFKTKRPLQNDLHDLIDEDSSEEDEEDMPTTNGVIKDGSDDEEDSDIEVNGQKSGGLVDDEAEVSGEDELSDDDEEGDDLGDSEDEEDEEDEEDSEMDDFINDGSVGIASDEDDIDIDEDDTPQRPVTKKSKHR